MIKLNDLLKLGLFKVKVTAGIGIQRIGSYSMLNQTDQPNQFGKFPHLDTFYQ
jgi:hypothetical protein